MNNNVILRLLAITVFAAFTFTACGLFEDEDFEILTDWDCPDLQLNQLDSCFMANGIVGILDSGCFCDTMPVFITYDCPERQADFYTPCTDAAGAMGYVNSACACEAFTEQMCVDSAGVAPGDWCITVNGDTSIITNDCLCGQELNFDCPQQQANFGAPCTDAAGNAGLVGEDCGCAVTTYNCPELQLNFGDSCRTVTGVFGEVNGNCDCVVTEVDCPEFNDNIGQNCLDAAGNEGIINENCQCVVDSQPDCPSLGANIGDQCITSDSIPGIIDANCLCVEPSAFDCPELQLNFRDTCSFDSTMMMWLVVDVDCGCS